MKERAPVIFWLLVAATICVDAVAYSWMVSEPYPYASVAAVAWLALVTGQLSVICIWSAMRLTKTFWTRIAPWLGVILATLLGGMFTLDMLTTWLAYYGVHAALLLAALWLFERTKFWQRRSGGSTSWRYSLANLLLVLTVVAVLLGAIRNTQLVYTKGWVHPFFNFGSVALAFVGVVSWSVSRHWVMQTAVVLGFAMILGACFLLTPEYYTAPLFPLFIGAHYLIQGIVMSAWLSFGSVLPVSQASVAAES